MKINADILRYLSGEELSTGLKIEMSREKYPVVSREAHITDLVRNKKVIHVGCSDHINIIKDKIRNKLWLHKLITDSAEECIGIDIDRESIDYIRTELGYRNVICGDILTDKFDSLSNQKWDYVVFGEIIEHLDNPVTFLKTFKERFGENIERFIITAPGIYNKQHFRNMMKYKEIINSDHRFSFTPYTISKVIVSAGYVPEKILYANLIKLTFAELVIRKLKYIFHLPVKYPFFYFKSIIITGTLN